MRKIQIIHYLKNGQDHMAVFPFNEYNISQIKPAFDVKERLMEIEAIANNPKALTFKTPSLKWNALVDFKRVMTVYGIILQI
jgi:hypothetical protein